MVFANAIFFDFPHINAAFLHLSYCFLRGNPYLCANNSLIKVILTIQSSLHEPFGSIGVQQKVIFSSDFSDFLITSTF
jgi:hypothetical protein